MGYRAGLVRALDALPDTSYAIWHDAPLLSERARKVARLLPFGSSSQQSRKYAETWRDAGPFTHVIAGTEASVVAASHARRVLGARLSVHTTVQRCHDKLFMKQELQRAGVPMTPFIDGNDPRSDAEVLRELGSPVVLKHRTSSGGRGLTRVHTEADFAKHKRHDRILEQFVDAPECSVESFITRGEVRFENVTEYLRKGNVNVVPGELDAETRARVLEISRQVIRTLRIQWGLVHLECFLTPNGPLFGEVALRPPGGYIMEALPLAYPLDAWKAFAAVELDLPFEFPKEPTAVAAVVVLHPGAGTVERVEGFEAVRDHPAVVRAKLKIETGSTIDRRTGVGEDVGYLLLRAVDRAALIDALRFVDETLTIDVVGPSS